MWRGDGRGSQKKAKSIGFIQVPIPKGMQAIGFIQVCSLYYIEGMLKVYIFIYIMLFLCHLCYYNVIFIYNIVIVGNCQKIKKEYLFKKIKKGTYLIVHF